MAESFLFSIATTVLEKITLLVMEEVCFAFKSDLKVLQDNMNRIKDVLLDAEQKQYQNAKLRRCMGKLRDIFYDAEDVLEEFERKALQKEVRKNPSISKKVRLLTALSLYSFSPAFTLRMGHKIKDINRRLEKLDVEWKSFELGVGGDNRCVIRRESYSFVNSSDVIGRDVDKENIINLLMQPTGSGTIPVIPIVGIGGLGKTVLAQMVYDDKRVTRFFPTKLWVCVAEEFDIKRLVREIICQKTKKPCDDLSLETLQINLRSLLENEKFLLVLDDVWNEDPVKWKELKDLLESMSDLPGNKIIVTTRSFKVASTMTSVRPYQLQGLPHEDCLTLFTRWAFRDGNEKRFPNLMRIGDEIVKKCRGIPLAVRTLGSLLFEKTEEREWMSVRDSEIWELEKKENSILPLLKLSYNSLPPPLQRCLAFLSLYKKDTFHATDDVILFWMANGLLEHPKRDEEWEDVGNRYLKELWSRCFIQDVVQRRFYFVFKVHDLMHDLASDVSQKEFRTLYSQTDPIDEKVRHISFCDDQPLVNVPQDLKKRKHVRTVFLHQHPRNIDLSFLEFCVSKFKYLRSLRLNDESLEALPNSIGTLKHLRILDLRGCRKITKLPSSFSKLQSLIMLKMTRVDLVQLPDSFLSFIRLRSLEISIGAKDLKEIPAGCWSSLKYLGLFHCHNFEFLFEGVQYLTSLQTLNLCVCPKVVSLPRSLKFLTKLEHLLVQSCGAINLRMEPEEEDQHLELRLKTFSLWDSESLTDLPRLLLEKSSCTLQTILINNCQNFEVLPEWLQNLTSLESLMIIKCPKLSSLPEGMNRLTKLRELTIRGCPRLTERCQRGGADWPKIARVQDITVI